MGIYHCPRCNAEFTIGTKFCQACGCNLEQEFLEEPICPTCNKIFSAGTKFCDQDGSRLTSADKLIPKCVICGAIYNKDTKFCPKDGGAVIAEAFRFSAAPNNGYDSSRLQYPKAPFGDRILASIIDGLLLLVCYIPALLFFILGLSSIKSYSSPAGFLLFLSVVLYIIPSIFFLFLDGYRQGQGFGKKMFGLMVVYLPENKPCSKTQSFLRNLIGYLLTLIPFIGWVVELVVALIDKRGRRLGDRAALTQVIERIHYTNK